MEHLNRERAKASTCAQLLLPTRQIGYDCSLQAVQAKGKEYSVGVQRGRGVVLKPTCGLFATSYNPSTKADSCSCDNVTNSSRLDETRLEFPFLSLPLPLLPTVIKSNDNADAGTLANLQQQQQQQAEGNCLSEEELQLPQEN